MISFAFFGLFYVMVRLGLGEFLIWALVLLWAMSYA